MIDYEVRLERCKRQDTKETMITCLDKASIDNHKDQTDDFIGAFYFVGGLIVAIIFIICLLNRIFR